MQCPLYRPLNAPVLSLMTELGERLFLLDTGCPFSFAESATELMAGAWFTQPFTLRRPPFSLTPLRERLGLPIEGFIGLKELIAHGDVFFAIDEGLLLLGEEARAHARTQLESDAEHIVSPLKRHQHSPISLTVRLNDEERSCYLDTGSRFVVTKASQPLAPDPRSPSYQLSLVTPFGSLPVTVSDGHKLQIEDHIFEGVCVASGAPEPLPNIVGMEWFTRFNTLLSFHDERAVLFPRGAPPEPWECLHRGLWLPPVELSILALDYQQNNRPFTVLPQMGRPLPDGLLPFTSYRIKGVSYPAGIEGINVFFNALTCSEELTYTFEGPSGEITVQSAPLFRSPLT